MSAVRLLLLGTLGYLTSPPLFALGRAAARRGHQTWRNFRIHGIPRCWAFRYDTHEHCRGLIWPWQKTGGDGECAEHWACMERAQEGLARLDEEGE